MNENNDQKFYDEIDWVEKANLLAFTTKVKNYVQLYQDILLKKFDNRKINVLELGAGTCTTSLVVSSLGITKEIICADISIKKMRYCVPKFEHCIVGCKPEEITYLELDFSRQKFDIASESIDLILFDSALHHTRSMWLTLEECFRILKPDGLVVAQREQYLGLLTSTIKLDNLLLTPEVISGVSENAYLRKQYEYYMRAIGFQPQFIAAPETLLQKFYLFLTG